MNFFYCPRCGRVREMSTGFETRKRKGGSVTVRVCRLATAYDRVFGTKYCRRIVKVGVK